MAISVGPLTIVVADDHPVFRAGIVRALDEDPQFVVIGEAADGPAAERLIVERAPALALVDLRMPGRDGLELLARLRHHEPPVAIVVLTSYTDASLVHSAMDAGAAAYVPKDSEREQILDVASMTPRTVEAHIASARRKLAAVTTADAIAAAEAWGLLEPGAP